MDRIVAQFMTEMDGLTKEVNTFFLLHNLFRTI